MKWIAKLSEFERKVLAKYIQCLSVDDTASSLSVEEQAVRNALRRVDRKIS